MKTQSIVDTRGKSIFFSSFFCFLKRSSIFHAGCAVLSQPRCELLLSWRDVDEVQRPPSHYPLFVRATQGDLVINVNAIVILVIGQDLRHDGCRRR